MYIHSFYADLLLSTRVLFDNNIFQNPNYIKKYEFNIGNRAIQLPKDFNTTYEFPNIVTTLNDESLSMGQRPDVSLSIAGFNVDQVPVLYDPVNLNILYVQEEMVNVPISITINCESQLQAKEAANVVKRWLPFNKFIQFLEYTSFLEISLQFLDDNLFKLNDGNIINLYTKLNKRSGRVEQCFSMTYKPFIRLDSVSTSIPDSTLRSFQVSVDITYMIQFPLFLYNDQQPKQAIERIDFDMNASAGFEPINDTPTAKMINNNSKDDLKKGYIKRQYLVFDDNSTTSTSNIDSVALPCGQTNIVSTNGNMSVVLGANDFIYITLSSDPNTQYKTDVNTIDPTTGVTIPVDNNTFLLVTKSINCTSVHISLNEYRHILRICFDPKDFLLIIDFSYNLMSGINTVKTWTNYTLDLVNNCVEFSFNNTDWERFRPSLIHPLFVQFYLSENNFTHQYGGTIPLVANVKCVNVNSNAAVFT